MYILGKAKSGWREAGRHQPTYVLYCIYLTKKKNQLANYSLYAPKNKKGTLYQPKARLDFENTLFERIFLTSIRTKFYAAPLRGGGADLEKRGGRGRWEVK